MTSFRELLAELKNTVDASTSLEEVKSSAIVSRVESALEESDDPTDDELHDLFSAMVYDITWPLPRNYVPVSVQFARTVLERWG